MPKVLGIDLGTTNSVAAYVEAGQPIILENAEGSRLTPSVVAVNPKTSERYVGLAAKRQSVVNPEHTIYSAKRLIGRRMEDPVVQEDVKLLPYKIERGGNGDAHVFMGDKTYSPTEIASQVLQKIKLDAETKLGEKITEAVITVPAYFNNAQRAGHHGRRQDRRPGSPAHHQRADGRRPLLRHGQACRGHRRRLRPRRRHL